MTTLADTHKTLVIVEEGDAIPEEIYQAIEDCILDSNSRVLVLFSPRERSGPVDQKEHTGKVSA